MRANGEAIRVLRQDKGVALRDLAHATGMDRGFLSRVERGERDASEETLAVVAAALDVEVKQILAPPEPEPEVPAGALVMSPVQASEALNGIKKPQWLLEQARARRIPHTRLGQTICFTPQNLLDLVGAAEVAPRSRRKAA